MAFFSSSALNTEVSMSEIKKVKCEKCGRMVTLNGVGSDSSGFYKALRKIFQSVFFFTSSAFRPAADWHDMAVHQGPLVGETHPEFVQRVDDHFLEMCLFEANKRSYFLRLYLIEKAHELRDCLKLNDGQNYPRKACFMRGNIDANEMVAGANARFAKKA